MATSGSLIEIENQEWRESLEWVIKHESPDRAEELLQLLQKIGEKEGLKPGGEQLTTPYLNTIGVSDEPDYPGNLELEEKIYNAIRWNAMAMVANANKKTEGIGGHISTFSSSSHLFEVALNHFLKGYEDQAPDLAYFQGHATPGIYARSFLEYRLHEKELDNFRLELDSENGLSSYPHPRLMPDYWRFPTVSMGLAPVQAIYQARFLKYMENIGLKEENHQHVWAFLGDGEMDEPESTGALAIAANEKLDNLTFVISCNLQRLDGPVRGNNKVVDELEGIFKGCGWNVIKVIWSHHWDTIIEKDKENKLAKKFTELVDGDLQGLVGATAEELREKLFDGDLAELIEDLDDEALEELDRGGHDPVKLYAAYHQAVNHSDGPTVILAQTVKGYKQGSAGEASNVSHQKKKFKEGQLKAFRDELDIPIEDKELTKDQVPYFRFDKKSEEYKYLKERRDTLKGQLPKREILAKKVKLPSKGVFSEFLKGTGENEVSTTGAFVKLLTKLLKDKNIGKLVVPIIPDEARTFGMDSLYKGAGIYASQGQKHEPVDKDSLLYYNEQKSGKIIEEGITEAGAISTFIAAGTSHMTVDTYSIPFFAFYSMFGFQRIGDFIWAAADARAKGFLIGGISGRTSLSGEGLQHLDGQSHLNALAFPTVKAYDPAFAYEMAVIIREGIKEMYHDEKDVFYYITITNQSYPMPKMPKGAEEGILKGIYAYQKSKKRKNADRKVNLLGSGAIMEEILKAARALEGFDIPVNTWSVTSYKALYDDAIKVQNQNLDQSQSKKNYLEKMLEDQGEVFVAATDYVKALPLSLSSWVPGRFTVLGTDGFGQSDSTPALRRHFKVNADYIVLATIKALHQAKKLTKKQTDTYRKKLDLK